MEYLKYKFNCGCIIDQAKAEKQREAKGFTAGHRLKCPKHPNAVMINRFRICPDCGNEYMFGFTGKIKERCDPCTIKHKVEYDLNYHKIYIKTGPKKIYKKGPTTLSPQPPDHNIVTDLEPNPVIKNIRRGPCEQGPCQLADMPKNNTTCVKCVYRAAYARNIERMDVVTPNIVKTYTPERTHILNISCG